MSQVPGVGRVHIRLDGLMIGRFLKDEKGRPCCEIGVLSKAEDHKFTVCYEVAREKGITGKHVEIPEGCLWELAIEGTEPDIEPFDSGTKPDRLNPPAEVTSPLRKDFRWVLNLESPDFPEHPEDVIVRSDQLKPIIRIKNGVVFNQQLTAKPLDRLLNGGAPEPFGLASDELGIDLNPKSGQNIVLKNIDKDEDIIRIPVTGEEDIFIFINNVPPESLGGNHFHFRMYYQALEVPPDRQYDFMVEGAEPGGHAGHVHNPQPPKPGEFQCGGGSGGSGAPLCGLVFKTG